SCPDLFCEPLDENLLHANLRVGAAMPPGPTHSLTALLLEHPNLRAARFTVDDADDARVGHERRSGQHLAAVLLEDEDAIDADFLTRLDFRDAVNGDDGAGRCLDL